MKRITSLTLILVLCMTLFVTINSYAASLDTISIETDKTVVRPGEEVRLTINFGTELGAYTFDIGYDNNIFDFVSATGGTANDNTNKVRVVFDSTGENTSKTNISIIFKAKEELTSSNPTELTVVGKGLANSDASISYDDITTPMVKNIIVEPEYVDYDINLAYTGEIIKKEEKDMKLTFSSTMGHFYEHARLIAEATSPEGATVKLMGINNEENVKQDIIQSGWGNPQGYEIGGKDFSQVLNLKAIFSLEGEYEVTLKLIDRGNSDSVISEKQYKFNVLAESVPEENEKEETEATTGNTNISTNTITQVPTSLPKTGANIYLPIGISIIFIICIVAYYRSKTKTQK